MHCPQQGDGQTYTYILPCIGKALRHILTILKNNCFVKANVSGRFISLRKNAEIQDRKYSVYNQNIVETQESETVKGRDALSAVDATEVAEGTETTTETDEDVQGMFFRLHDEDAKQMNLYFLITKLVPVYCKTCSKTVIC